METLGVVVVQMDSSCSCGWRCVFSDAVGVCVGGLSALFSVLVERLRSSYWNEEAVGSDVTVPSEGVIHT